MNGYAGGYSGYGSDVPDMVKQFVVYFYRHIRERNIREIYSMYEVSFVKLSERFYKGTTWPEVEVIADLVERDHVFCLLYKEMYYRHLYASMQPTLDQRIASWENYCMLFSIILNSQVNMQLPNGWLWDMVDECIYQFQSFQQYRGRLSQKSAEELTQLRQCGRVWDAAVLLNYLQAFVRISDISGVLGSPEALENFHESEGYEERRSNVPRMMGYFSLVGLLRVHTLIGDYHAALKALGPIHPFQKTKLYACKIAGCNITLYYHAGFCYLMMRRYLDASRAFNTILTYINQVKQYHSRTPQYDQILKKNEQMHALLAMTLALCPAAQKNLDEVIMNQLRDKYGEKVTKMVRGGGEGTYEELFTYACPKFITAAPPALDAPTANTNQEVYRLQLRCFLGLVHEQHHLPALKQLLSLYTSISLSKLGSLLDLDETALRSQLMLLKAASMCKTWSGEGGALAGTLQPAGDIEFFVDVDTRSGQEVVHVAEAKPVQRQNDFLVHDIARFDSILKSLIASEAPGSTPRALAPPAGAY
ncbi:hypothetical protein WJX73_002987 [Symbiochloris irregularis]|uniref:Eukaryotic translation initiation factor 3 subunit L n=1 Tax=Symbiochloris irregularis TaxID=706552 RepID=A0AAW1P709_9CHLO